LKRCAAWLADQLRQIGLDQIAVLPTARYPIVYAEWRGAPGRPTVLIYTAMAIRIAVNDEDGNLQRAAHKLG